MTDSPNPTESPHTVLQDRFFQLHQAQHDPQIQWYLWERCRRDIGYWFDHFCWTFDPRQAVPNRPFVLYPFQRRFVETLSACIDQGSDLLVEKSRDMGVSWLILLTLQYYWLFREGSHFLVGSRKLDLVDKRGDLSSLFEKLRYNFRWMPRWLWPKKFHPKSHETAMKLVNPENGNTITGESSNADFGRGGRYRAIFMDEFPFWGNDEQSYAASGQSSPCRIVVGTPYGKNNAFARLRWESPIRVATLHWRDHPLKDDAWYKGQCQRMSPDEIARELDINYHLSVSHRVFSGFNEQHKREGLRPITGRRIIRSWDFGYHCPACLLIQVDGHDRVRVLDEIVGHQELLVQFAKRVLDHCEKLSQEGFEGGFDDVCDPAGSQKSDKHDKTSIELLNTLGVYPFYQRSPILRGIELIRMKLAATIEELPGLLVDRRCRKLIEAFEGGYRYVSTDHEYPLEVHPYEDVMDCLRYAMVHKCDVLSHNPKKPRIYRPLSPYTGY